MISKKTILSLSTIIMLGILLFVMVLHLDKSNLKPIKVVETPTSKMEFHFDVVNVSDSIRIEGWSFLEGESIEKVDCSIVLENIDTKEAFELPTNMLLRADMNLAFPDEYDYTKSGFLAKAKTSKFSLDLHDYEIIIKYFNNENELFLRTGEYVTKVREIQIPELDGTGVLFSVDHLEAKKKKLTVSGWALIEGQTMIEGHTKIILRNNRTNKGYVIPTKTLAREDLNSVFSDGADYTRAGFLAIVDTWKFDLKYDPHEVVIGYFQDGNERYIPTGQYVVIED